MTNLDSVLKSRDITLLTKVHIVKAMVFPLVMYSCEGWTIKKAEHQRIDAFELWCWRRLLKVPWTERRSNQSILSEINPEFSLEGLMRKLKLQYLGHLIGEVPDSGKDWGQKEKRVSEDEMAGQHHWCNERELGQTLEDIEGQEDLACCSPWGHKDLDTTGWLNNNISLWAITLWVHFLFPPSSYPNIGAVEEEEGSEWEQTLPLPPQLESDAWSGW